MLCQQCYKVLTAYLAHLPNHIGATQYMTHHISLESFARSVAQSCQVCSIVAESINYTPPGSAVSRFVRLPFQQLHSAVVRSKEPEIFFVNTKGMTPLQELKSKSQRPKQPIFTEFEGRLEDNASRCSIIFFVVRTENPRHAPFAKPGRDREAFVLQPCEGVGRLLHSKEISSNTGSIGCLRQVSDWYNDCLQNHALCNTDPTRSTYCPIRLLDIGVDTIQQNTIVLIEPGAHEMTLPYMTLSHCWGSVPLLQHTALTEPLLRSGVAISSLPPTFQEAVKVARYLNCRYLWIDSLCIVQDDPRDWGIEAVLMDKVYSHSLCNIAATGAANSLGGLFFERDPTVAMPCIFKFKPQEEPSESFLIIQKYTRQSSLEKQPLQKRGWVLQERLLARRLIDFTSKELLWQCRQTQASESFPLGFPSNVTIGIEEPIAIILNKAITTEFQHEWINDEYIFLSWDYMVTYYSKRLLTRPEDKLIAISGIAKQIQDGIQGEYVAGLWREALPQQLLWFVTHWEQAGGPQSKRAAEYRAPSWSWAAIDGAVRWGGSLKKNNEERIIADVLEVSVTPRSDKNPFGVLAAGWMKVNAHLWRVNLAWNPESEDARAVVVRDVDTGVDLSLQVRCFLDVPEKEDLEHRMFFCMPVQYTRNEGKTVLDLQGLVLEQLEGGGNGFSRVGYYTEGMRFAGIYYSVKVKGDGEVGKREVLIF
jgi:hypothetical protein